MFRKFYLHFSVLVVLVQRDYALQYAGSVIGLVWILIQNATLIGIYALVFGILDLREGENDSQYLSYLLSGMLFWIPIQEYLIRGTTILMENRHLIKRSSLGVDIFAWVPWVQMLIHFGITALPVLFIIAFLDEINWGGLVPAFIVFVFSGFFLFLILSYFARVNILLRDISPLIRLLTQLLFWALPIVYVPFGFLVQLNHLNPLSLPLDLFRYFLLKHHGFAADPLVFLVYLFIAIGIFLLVRMRLNRVVMDQL